MASILNQAQLRFMVGGKAVLSKEWGCSRHSVCVCGKAAGRKGSHSYVHTHNSTIINQFSLFINTPFSSERTFFMITFCYVTEADLNIATYGRFAINTLNILFSPSLTTCELHIRSPFVSLLNCTVCRHSIASTSFMKTMLECYYGLYRFSLGQSYH